MSWEIWVTNYGSNEVTRMDENGNYLGWYPVGSHPFGIAFDDEDDVSGKAFVSNSGDTTISLIDPTNPADISGIDVSGNPHGICADDVSGVVWAVLYNNPKPPLGNLVKIDMETHEKTYYDLETSGSVFFPEMIIAGYGRILISHKDADGNGMLTMFSKENDTISFLDSIKVGKDPFGITWLPVWPPPTSYAYVVNYGSNTVTRIPIGYSDSDPTGFAPGAIDYPVGNGPRCIYWEDPSGLQSLDPRFWVTNELSNNISILDKDGNRIDTIEAGSSPIGVVSIGIDAGFRKVFVANFNSNNVKKYEGDYSELGKLLKTIGVGTKPFLLARRRNIYD